MSWVGRQAPITCRFLQQSLWRRPGFWNQPFDYGLPGRSRHKDAHIPAVFPASAFMAVIINRLPDIGNFCAEKVQELVGYGYSGTFHFASLACPEQACMQMSTFKCLHFNLEGRQAKAWFLAGLRRRAGYGALPQIQNYNGFAPVSQFGRAAALY